MTSIYLLSDEQFDDMKHAIGFRSDRIKGRIHRKYESFRNYYTTCGDNKSWDDLATQGLAIKRDFQGGGEGAKIYFVSDDGIKFLSKMLDVQITESR